MKKIISTIAVGTLLLCLMLIVPAVKAQDLTKTPAGSSSSAPLLGNNHYYSVTVKNSGMLVINAKIVLANNTDKEKQDFVFSGLGKLKGNPIGYQQVKGRHCDQIDYNASKCLSYGDPDYSTYSYDSGYDEANKYQILDLKVDSGVLSFSLRTPIAPYKSTAVVLSYYLSEQTENGLFGQKKFTFSSLEDKDLIKDISISVSTDADLYKKSNRSSVTSSATTTSEIGAISNASVLSKSFDSAVSGIGSYGNWINKTGKDIIPTETFNVSGTYATNWFGLYWKMLLIWLFILLLVILGIWWLVRRAGNRSLAKNALAAASSDDLDRSFHKVATFKNFLISFLVAAGAILLVIGGVYLDAYFGSIVGYDYSILIDLMALMLLFILGGCVLAWPIYQGVKRGINLVLVTVISYVIAIIIAAVIGVIVIGSSDVSNNSSTMSVPIMSDSV